MHARRSSPLREVLQAEDQQDALGLHGWGGWVAWAGALAATRRRQP